MQRKPTFHSLVAFLLFIATLTQTGVLMASLERAALRVPDTIAALALVEPPGSAMARSRFARRRSDWRRAALVGPCRLSVAVKDRV